MELTSRELSIIIWSIAALAWTISHATVRSALYDVLKAAANPTLSGFFGLLALYATAEVFLLHSVGLWRPAFIKTTVVWFILTAISSGASAMSGFDDPPYWKPITDSLRVVVLLELIVNAATFSLPVELVLVPVATLLAVLAAVAEIKHKGEPVQKFLTVVQVGFGFTVLAVAGARAATQLSAASTSSVLIDFLLPAVLSLLFIPAMYLTAVYARYEWLFLKVRGDRRYRWYAKWRLLRLLGFRPQRVLEFGRKYAFDLPAVRSKKEFDQLIGKEASFG